MIDAAFYRRRAAELNEKATQEPRNVLRAAYASLALNWELLAEAMEQDVNRLERDDVS